MRTFHDIAELESALALAPLEQGAYRFAKQYGPAGFLCSVCEKEKPFELNLGTGYARDQHTNAFVCYDCCGERDHFQMIGDGKIALYLTHPPIPRNAQYPFADGKLTNWPGTLSIPCRVKRGHHNIAGSRYDVWFNFEGFEWHGVQYGEFTQICHCKRTKKAAS